MVGFVEAHLSWYGTGGNGEKSESRAGRALFPASSHSVCEWYARGLWVILWTNIAVETGCGGVKPSHIIPVFFCGIRNYFRTGDEAFQCSAYYVVNMMFLLRPWEVSQCTVRVAVYV